MKLALILTLARYLMYCRTHRTLWGMVPPFALTLVPVILILKEPDLEQPFCSFRCCSQCCLLRELAGQLSCW